MFPIVGIRSVRVAVPPTNYAMDSKSTSSDITSAPGFIAAHTILNSVSTMPTGPTGPSSRSKISDLQGSVFSSAFLDMLALSIVFFFCAPWAHTGYPM